MSPIGRKTAVLAPRYPPPPTTPVARTSAPLVSPPHLLLQLLLRMRATSTSSNSNSTDTGILLPHSSNSPMPPQPPRHNLNLSSKQDIGLSPNHISSVNTALTATLPAIRTGGTTTARMSSMGAQTAIGVCTAATATATLVATSTAATATEGRGQARAPTDCPLAKRGTEVITNGKLSAILKATTAKSRAPMGQALQLSQREGPQHLRQGRGREQQQDHWP
mmetsp:Transcript_15448/g.33836  ORF Transcript_15448/g.33836 Transcript_15448/m.33836 type:complete len:221 (-) Transcript_15448:390-1052(-)